MKLCFPVTSDKGANSALYGHFASSPLFLIYDTETEKSTTVDNCDEKKPFAGCNPFQALKGRQLDGIIVAGIGDDTLRIMNLCGYKVFQAESELVADNLPLMTDKKLDELFVLNSHLEGKCTEDDGSPRTCNHSHDHDHGEGCEHSCC